MANNQVYGWFDDATQATPSYDPPRDAPCLFCGKPLSANNVRTYSLMYQSGYANRSYFYRVHRTCAEDGGPLGMDSVVLDMIAKNGD